MPTKLLTLLVSACSVLFSMTTCYGQTVQKYTLSSFSTISNDSVYVVAGQSVSGESANPKVLHGYLPFQYSTLDVKVIEDPTLELTLWPNPTSDQFQISFSKADDYTVRLYSSSGTLLFTQLTSSPIELFSISNLASGLYYVRVSNSAGETFKQKVIKQ